MNNLPGVKQQSYSIAILREITSAFDRETQLAAYVKFHNNSYHYL